jgi:hypothetical protein
MRLLRRFLFVLGLEPRTERARRTDVVAPEIAPYVTA